MTVTDWVDAGLMLLQILGVFSPAIIPYVVAINKTKKQLVQVIEAVNIPNQYFKDVAVEQGKPAAAKELNKITGWVDPEKLKEMVQP